MVKEKTAGVLWEYNDAEMTTAPGDAPAEFTVSFEGPAVDDFTMPVRDLAPALLGLGDAFERANVLLNGDRAAVSLEVRAARQGSFEVVLILEQLFEEGVSFFSNDFVSSAANIKDLFFSPWGGGASVGGVGLIALIKRLRGGRPKEVERSQDAVTLEIDKVRLSVPSRVAELYKDGSVRRHLEEAVKPVVKEGIERMVVKEAGQRIEAVEKADVESFRTEITDDSPTETVIPRQRLKPTSVSFSKDGKWRLNDGEKNHWYSITDQHFLREVAEGKRRFGSGDILVCEVVMTQSVDATGDLRLEYTISKVLSHSNPPEQIPLV